MRYRLRLGPFVTEAEAEGILAKVRDVYPGALTATADANDLRVMASLGVKLAPALPVPPTLTEGVSPSKTLESTRTVRALTPLELDSSEALRWYVIELAISEAAYDPATVPDLDIFNVYRLYSVASIDQGKIMHALRVGFFGEEVAAAAVAHYLKSFYEQPTIRRVSVAERERFANQPLEPRKDVGGSGKHTVIEITDERYVRDGRSMGTAVNAVKK
ncbi:MAG: hypothetical protein M3N50_03550 [Pseudomonadota bacterium]|nr:hypothetical protein [Pseudomonadota bacterium]